MATAEAALRALLTQGSPNPVAAIIGARAHAKVLPQNPVLPAIRYQRISTPRLRSLGATHAEYATPRFQLDMYATTETQVLMLADAVRDLIQGFRGTSASFRIDDISAEDEAGGFESNVLAGGAGAYTQRLDVFIAHPE